MDSEFGRFPVGQSTTSVVTPTIVTPPHDQSTGQACSVLVCELLIGRLSSRFLSVDRYLSGFFLCVEPHNVIRGVDVTYL